MDRPTRESQTVPDRVFDDSMQLLTELCAISSPSGDFDGLERMAARVSNAFESVGLSPSVDYEPGLNGRDDPVLVARGPETVEGYVLALGHLDTVLPGIAPECGAGRLVGTGALDMKGGLAAFAGALQLIADSDGSPIPPDLVFVGVPDKEVGGPIFERAVRTWGEKARAVLVLEPGALRPGGAETMVTGRRGLTVWRLEARGRAAHSGLAYWQGRSALAAAATWCGAVQRMSEKGAGPIVNVGRIVGGDSEFVQDLGEEHHFIGTSQRLNVIPDRCVAEGEVRFLDTADRDRMLGQMREIAGQLATGWGVEMELVEVDQLPPVDPRGSGGKLAQRLVDFAAKNGWTLELEDDRGGVSFPNFLPDPSAVTVLDGLGPCGGGMHTREEYLDLVSLRRRIGLIAEAIRLVADRG